MSLFPFAPSPTFGVSEHRMTSFANAFTSDQIEEIVSYCDKLKKKDGYVGNNNLNDQVRSSTVSWVELTNDTKWIYQKMADVVRHLNGKYFCFDLYGFHDHLQYTMYDGSTSDHYTWHLDNGVKTDSPPRKLSVVLQLSDPSEYTGGDLEILVRTSPIKAKKEKGSVIAFPSFTLHRVTPVTSGTRRTLVAWVCGPAFR